MALADRRRRLAAIAGQGARRMAGLRRIELVKP
jgi:hypothetical protein